MSTGLEALFADLCVVPPPLPASGRNYRSVKTVGPHVGAVIGGSELPRPALVEAQVMVEI
jgi:hypothetical protein